jgi:hypothetical protein
MSVDEAHGTGRARGAGVSSRASDEPYRCFDLYLISRTLSEDDAHRGNIDDSAPSPSRPAPSARRYAALGLDRSERGDRASPTPILHAPCTARWSGIVRCAGFSSLQLQHDCAAAAADTAQPVEQCLQVHQGRRGEACGMQGEQWQQLRRASRSPTPASG